MNQVKRILSGIRATGNLHLGNYLGMVKAMLEQQKKGEYEILFMVADVHATTTPFNPDELRVQRKQVVIDYLSVGLDPEKSTVFLQADVHQHAELATYLASTITIARMQHLPTFKEKVKQHPNSATMALLNYPILMAADILLYKSDLVPTGIDQEPHLEVAREVARKMNDTYGMDFPEPKRFASSGEYVPSLTGEGKMSKSVEGSYINLTDSLDSIKEKISKTPTDSGKGSIEPYQNKISSEEDIVKYISDHGSEALGVAALLEFVELFQGKKRRKAYENDYTSDGIRYGDLKNELSEVIDQELKPIQEKRKELESNQDYVDQVIADGAEKARTIASQTVAEVKQKMGLA